MLEQPWALTLWTYQQLNERKRITDLVESIERVNTAILNALAFNEPHKLSIERDTAIAVAKRTAGRDSATDTAWRERAARLVAAIEGGRVLEGEVVNA